MGNVNKVIIVGNLGGDPELKHLGSGTAVARFSVATSEKWTDRLGQKQERTDWHRVVAWSKLAELVGQYLAKGRLVCVEGRLHHDKWTDKEGKERYTTEIVADEVTFLSSGKTAADAAAA